MAVSLPPTNLVSLQVYGISSDSPSANKAFAESQRLPFPLLTDAGGALRKVRIEMV